VGGDERQLAVGPEAEIASIRGSWMPTIPGTRDQFSNAPNRRIDRSPQRLQRQETDAGYPLYSTRSLQPNRPLGSCRNMHWILMGALQNASRLPGATAWPASQARARPRRF